MPTPAASSPAALLDARLQEFNLLPSRSLHAERARALDGAGDALAQQPAVQRALHRRWSAQLLAQLGEHAQPVLDLSHAALPLALAAPALLARLARDAGVTLLGGHLRRTIARDAVLQARSALGDASLDWARQGAAALHPGLEAPGPWIAPGLDRGADLLGAGLLELLERGATGLVGAQHLVDQFDRFATLALGFLNNVSMFTNELNIKHASQPSAESRH